MLKVNQPNGFRAGMGSSIRRTCALIWVLQPLQTNHSFVLLLTKPHCQSVLLGSLFRVCKATPHTSVRAEGKRTPLPGTERSGAGAMPVLRRTPVSRACRAPRWHLLATTWAWACSFLTPATEGQLPFSPKVRIIKQ